MFQNTFFLRRPRVADIADIYQNCKRVKRMKNCIKMQSVSVFLDTTKIADFKWKSAEVNRTQGLCHVIYMLIYMFLGSSLGNV